MMRDRLTVLSDQKRGTNEKPNVTVEELDRPTKLIQSQKTVLTQHGVVLANRQESAGQKQEKTIEHHLYQQSIDGSKGGNEDVRR